MAADAKEGQEESSEGGEDQPGRPSREAKEEGDRRQQEAEEAMERAKGRLEDDDGRGETGSSGSPLDEFHQRSGEGAAEEGSRAQRRGG
jgi:hypothetical protein